MRKWKLGKVNQLVNVSQLIASNTGLELSFQDTQLVSMPSTSACRSLSVPRDLNEITDPRVWNLHLCN